MGMPVEVAVQPDPSSVPMPMASDPEIIRAGGHGDGLGNRDGRLLGGYDFRLRTVGRGGRHGHRRVVALDPDPPAASYDPPAGDPFRARMSHSVPAAPGPIPAIVVPAPMPANPDESGTGGDGHHLGPRRRRLRAERSTSGTPTLTPTSSAGAGGEGGGGAHQRKKSDSGEFHGGTGVGWGSQQIRRCLEQNVTAGGYGRPRAKPPISDAGALYGIVSSSKCCLIRSP